MPIATIAEADREYARNVGMDNLDRAWILSDRDVWYPNPAYSGPPVPHPEYGYDDREDYEDYGAAPAENSIESPEAGLLSNLPHDDGNWGVPF